MKAFMHSCGGWYVAHEDKDGFHHAPPFCSREWCFPTPEKALAAWEDNNEKD